MENREKYCPLSEECTYKSVQPVPNSYFLIEPFDSAKNKREGAIEKALRTYYKEIGGEPKLVVSNLEDSHKKGLYCDICSKIKSSQYCIVDVTGKLYKTVNKKNEIDEKIFLSSNVAFELGLAYGLNKPTFVLSKKINGKREFLSDIKFIRYTDVQGNNLTKSLYETLSQNNLINIGFLDFGNETEDVMKIIKHVLQYKKSLPIIREKKYKINTIVWDKNQIVGVITDCDGLFKEMCFEIYITEGVLEKKIGILKVDHVNNKDGFAQVLFNHSDDCKDTYLDEIYTQCYKNGEYIPCEHRLVPIISESIEGIIERIDTDQFETLFKFA